MNICGPHRFATGLLKTTDLSNHRVDKDRLLTSDSMECEFTVWTPLPSKIPNQIAYERVDFGNNEFQEILIRITAGDVAQLEGTTYDGTSFSCPITGSLDLKASEFGFAGKMVEGTCKDVENIKVVEVDEDEKQKRMTAYWTKRAKDTKGSKNCMWSVSLESGGYGGESGITEDVEKQVLNCERDFSKYYRMRKRFFKTREDAEDYVRPIAEKAFKTFISDWEDNEEEDDYSSINEHKKRGLQELRLEDLKEDSPYYKLYHSKSPVTLWTCPSEYDCDRIGQYFAQVNLVQVY